LIREIKEKFQKVLDDAIEGKLESDVWKTPRGILAKVKAYKSSGFVSDPNRF